MMPIGRKPRPRVAGDRAGIVRRRVDDDAVMTEIVDQVARERADRVGRDRPSVVGRQDRHVDVGVEVLGIELLAVLHEPDRLAFELDAGR